MTPGLESRLDRLLTALEKQPPSAGGLADIKKALSDNTEALTGVQTEVVRLSVKMGQVEVRLDKLEDCYGATVEETGRHELARVQERLKDTEIKLAEATFSKSHWAGYAIKTFIAVLILLATGGVGWLARAAMGG